MPFGKSSWRVIEYVPAVVSPTGVARFENLKGITKSICRGRRFRDCPYVENHCFCAAIFLQQVERLRLGFDPVKRGYLNVRDDVCDQPSAFGLGSGKRLLFVVLAIAGYLAAIAERDAEIGREKRRRVEKTHAGVAIAGGGNVRRLRVKNSPTPVLSIEMIPSPT